jgi:hypothetical protein
MNHCILILSFFSPNLKIIGSQEIERIFFLVITFTNLKRCHLQSIFFKKLIFVKKIELTILGLVVNLFLVL